MAAERTIRIKVDGDGRGLVVTVRTVEKEIERLGKQVDAANKRFAGAARGFAKFAVAAASLSSSTSGIAGLGATLATASGVLVGFPALVAAGGAALGTFKLGAAGAEKALAGLDKTLVPLKAQVSAVFESGLAPAVASLNRVIPKTADGFSAIAAEMAGIAAAAADTLALPANTRDLNTVLERTTGLMSGARRAAGPLTQAFIDVVSVGSEGFGGIGDRIAAASERFAGFIRAARESGQLRAYLDNGINALRQMWQTLKDIGAIVRGVFSGISEGAGGVTASFQPAIRSMREFVESTRGQEFLNRIGAALAEIGHAVGGVLAAGLHAVAPLIGPLAQTFATLASTAAGILVPALTILAPILQVIGTFLAENEAVVRVLASVLGGLAGAWLSVQASIKLVTLATGLWNTISGVATNNVVGLGTAFAGMSKAARIASLSMGAIGIVASLIGAALALFSGRSAEAEQQQQALAAASKSVAKVLEEENQALNKRTRAAAAAALEEAGLLKLAESSGIATRDLTDAYLGDNEARKRVNATIQDQIDYLNRLQDAALAEGNGNRAADLQREVEGLEELQTQIDGAIGTRENESAAIERQQRATEESTSATQDATSAIQAHIAAMEELINKQREAAGVVLNQREAERDLLETFAQADEAIKSNGRTLDANTKQGRDNQAALDSIVSKTFDLMEAQAQNGASNTQLRATMEESRRKFIEVATQMGLSAGEAYQLAQQLGLIPGVYTARVRVDATGVEGLLSSIRGSLASIGNQILNINWGSVFGGRRAAGGPVLPGRSYLVGERGPEILRLAGSGGTVVPNHQTERMLGGDTIVYVTIDGQQLQGRIDRTVRENNRSLKRAATSGAGGAR